MKIKINIKVFSLLFLMTLNLSCSSLINPQEQPVNLLDEKAKIYVTTCSGLAETIGTCHEKAKRTCERSYQVINERLDSSGVHREIKFQCK